MTTPIEITLTLRVCLEASPAMQALIGRLFDRAAPAPDTAATSSQAEGATPEPAGNADQRAPLVKSTDARTEAVDAALRRHPGQWTPERDALLLRLRAQAEPNSHWAGAALKALNALPGAPFAGKNCLHARLAMLQRKVPPVTPAPTAAPTAAPTPPPPVAAAPAPSLLVRDAETILRWGAERGLDRFRLDLDAINEKARALGAPTFALSSDGRQRGRAA